MRISCAKGSPEQMLDQFKARIDELQGINIDSSFDYPDDLEDLENGEYESHATEPVNASVDGPTQEVLNFLASKGYDTSDKSVINYADAVAEYMDMSRQAYEHEGMESPYSLDQWYEDTMMNYPEELEDLPMVEACDAITSATITGSLTDVDFSRAVNDAVEELMSDYPDASIDIINDNPDLVSLKIFSDELGEQVSEYELSSDNYEDMSGLLDMDYDELVEFLKTDIEESSVYGFVESEDY